MAEGQEVKAGQLIAVIESDDLQAARKAAEATAQSQKYKLGETLETEQQMRGETGSATINAEAMVEAAKASLAQAQAKLRTPTGGYNPNGGPCAAGDHERAGQRRCHDKPVGFEGGC